MVRPEELRRLIDRHQRRLQKLKEQQALKGNNAPPELLIDLEDTEAIIEQLQTQLNALEGGTGPPAPLVDRPFSPSGFQIEPDLTATTAAAPAGGVKFSGPATVYGDVTGHDKIVYGPQPRPAIPTSAPLSPGELAEIRWWFNRLKVDLTTLDLPEHKKFIAQEFLDQLEQELTCTDRSPDDKLIKCIGEWLLTGIPAWRNTLAMFFTTPVVSRAIILAGDVTVSWVKERFTGLDQGGAP